MQVFKTKVITTNNYFCSNNLIFKGYICLPIKQRFHMYPKYQLTND